jgi:quercetin dioxygenase-like cupin family protein
MTSSTQTQHKVIVVNLLENPKFTVGQPYKGSVAMIAGVNFIKHTIKAGDHFPSHHTNRSVFVVVLKGKVDFCIDDQTYTIMDGAFLEIPKDAEHSIIAKENSVFLVGTIEEKESSTY